MSNFVNIFHPSGGHGRVPPHLVPEWAKRGWSTENPAESESPEPEVVEPVSRPFAAVESLQSAPTVEQECDETGAEESELEASTPQDEE